MDILHLADVFESFLYNQLTKSYGINHSCIVILSQNILGKLDEKKLK